MKIKNILPSLYCLFCLFVYTSCSKEKTFDCVKSTGKTELESRYFENYSILYVEDDINVVLLQSTAGKIMLEGGGNVLPKIKVEQEGNRINISNSNKCNWVRSYDKSITVYVGVDQVKEVIQQGYGKITGAEHLKTDTLGISNLTYGDTELSIDAIFLGFIAGDHSSILLKGSCVKLAGSSAKNALVNTQDMHTSWCIFTNNSMLDAKIYSDSLVQIEIGGKGNTLCAGRPNIVQYGNSKGEGVLLFP